jgi:hypothetical protein
MREQVGRSIGLSARKVQVRYQIPDHLTRLTDTTMSIASTWLVLYISGLVPGEYFL